jgi:hypothetical protein
MKKLLSLILLCLAVGVWAAEKNQLTNGRMNASIIEACQLSDVLPVLLQYLAIWSRGTR